MAGVEDDMKLVQELISWADSNSKRVADSIGVANTTINRFANGTAKTRLGRGTLEKLRKEYPAFPAFAARPASNAVPFQMEGASLERMREDLPIYGTALGAARIVDGEAIEQTTLNRGEIIHYGKRPVILNGKADAYGLYVSGSSMSPRFEDGELLLADPKGRERPGEDVIVYLRTDEADLDDGNTARAVLVKRLVRRTAQFYELQQYSPPLIFRIEREDVLRVDRVIPWTELVT